MTEAQLRAALALAQTAYIEIMTGGKAVTLSYAQGDGAKSVTRQMTSPAGVLAFIMMLEQALGICGSRRRPLRPVYGP